MAKSSGKDIRAGGAIITLEGIDKSLSKALQVGMAQVNGFAKAVDAKLNAALTATSGALTDVGGKLQDWGGQALAVGGAVSAAFGAAAFSFAEAGSQLDDLSQRTGVAATEWSKLAYAAKLSGTQLETLEKGNLKLTQALAAAADGGKEANLKFAELGLSAAELAKLPLDARLAKVGAAINRLPDDASRTAAAMELFGKAGNELLPLLKEGPGGLAELTSEAERLGVVMSNEDAAAAAQFGDTLDQVSLQMGALTNSIGAAIVKGLQPYSEDLLGILRGVIDWTKANPALIQTVAAVAAGVAAGGVALLGIGTAAVVAGGAVSALAGVLGVVTGAATLLISPLGIGAAVIAGLIVDWQTLGDTGFAALSDLTGGFFTLLDQASIAGQGIAAALALGDLTTAGQIALLGLRVAWSNVVGYFTDKWLSWRNFFLTVWDEASGTLASLMIDAMFSIERAWNTITVNLANGFDWFIEQAMKGWNWLLEAIDGVAGTDLKGMLGNAGEFNGGAQARADRTSQAQARDEQLQRDQAQTQANAVADRVGRALEREQELAATNDQGRAERQKLFDEMETLANDTNNRAANQAANAARAAAAARSEMAQRAGGELDSLDGKQTSVSGSFSAAALFGIGGSAPLDRVAAATEASRKASETAAQKLDAIEQHTRKIDQLTFS